ncbi:ATP-binding cassette subfamily C protein CydD [Catenulispora sp. GP43]|uniref:thiol reductant ABC exporter subunit CydD n=1 Tax=Catenulispora sp. GP43 TaxID=3156263 RepID=UPI0035165386
MKPVDPRLFAQARVARAYLLLCVAFGLADAILLVVGAGALAGVVADGFLHGLTPARALPALAVVTACVIGRSVLAWAGDAAATATSAAVKSHLRQALLAHDVALGARRPDAAARHGESALLATRGLDALDGYFARYLPQVVLAAVVPLVIAIRILAADRLSGIIVALTVPLVPVFMILVGLASKAAMDRQRTALNRLSGHFLEVLSGLPTLKAFGRSRAQSDVIRRAADAQRRTTMTTLRWAFLSALVLELLATLSVALVAVAIGLRLVGGDLALRDGLLALILAPEVYLPLRRLGARYHDAAEGLAATDQVFTRLAEPVPDAGTIRIPGGYAPGIRMDHVTVRRGDRGAAVFEDFDAEFAPGRLTGLAGPSGAGKSTLLHLILGLAASESGRVLVDGRDLADLDLQAWRSRIAWVPQKPFLTAGTVAENIRLGRPGASDAEVAAAAERARLDIALDRQVGVRGTALSGGQVRRLAIARALLRDAPIVLLDEPTEGLDGDTEQDVLDVLATVLSGRTCVLVTHRAAVERLCDSVLTIGEPRQLLIGASA